MKDSLVFEMVFVDGAGKNRKITISKPAQGITADVAQQVMAIIVESDIFKDENGLDLYVAPVAARYVAKDVTDVYTAQV